MTHLDRCKLVKQALSEGWSKLAPDGKPIALRFAILAAVLSRQNEGKQGAGLTGGKQQEDLFRDMLMYCDRRFSETAPEAVQDADYYFEGYPLSHKTIGFNGTGDLALAWSKNGPSGLVRNEFHASMVIMCLRDPAKSGPLRGAAQGAYVIPIDWLQANITFSSNNKTDSLIRASEIGRGMQYAKSQGLLVPLAYRHVAGGTARVSVWYSGAGTDAPPLGPSATS